MDFTQKRYKKLLMALSDKGYTFQTFEEFMALPSKRRVVLRHDVDRKPYNALAVARIEKELGIKASYHFRVISPYFNEEVVKSIIEMGHEAAYHYEDLGVAARKDVRIDEGSSGEIPKIFQEAYRLFRDNLKRLREFYPVKIISMHGSPLSAYDNREIWLYYRYRDDGIICEPYFDIDLAQVMYLTDTGRRWDGERTNLRDKAKDKKSRGRSEIFNDEGWASIPIVGSAMDMTTEAGLFQKSIRFRSTRNLIRGITDGVMPDAMIINTHPQRWSGDFISWMWELIWQNTKNSGKVLVSFVRAKRDQHVNIKP